MSAFEFKEDTETRQLTCFVMPADPAEISAFKLKMALADTEFKTLYVFNENVDPLISEAMAVAAERTRDGGDQAEGSEPLPLASAVVAERRDGAANIKISDDQMVADAVVTTTCGGDPIDAGRIRAALAEAGVTQGIKDSEIAVLVTEAQDSPGGLEIKRKVAEGTPPGRGTPTRFENVIVPFQDRVLQPKENADGSIDMLDLGDIDTVEPGQPLVRRHPAQPGPDGYNVLGEPISADPPKEVEFAVGEGTQISPDDPHLLVATCNGVPHRQKNGMSVDDVLQTEEVGIRTGHIDLEGNLLVKGDIRPDMKVKVTGNLTVLGFIESAHVEAGGDITVRNGIIGPPPDSAGHDCEVKARNLEGKYAQNAKLTIEQDIRLSSHMLHCHARCHSLFVGKESSRDARLAGGSVQAENTVAAAVLGAEAGSITKISFDGRVLEMMERLNTLHEERQQKEQTMTSLVATYKKLQAVPKHTPELDEKLQRIRNTIEQFQSDSVEMREQEDNLQHEIEAVRTQCHVTAWHSIHAGVELHCAGIHHRFSSDRGPGTLGIRDGTWRSVDDPGSSSAPENDAAS